MPQPGVQPLLADGFEEAFLGWFQRIGEPPIALYDREACEKIPVQRDGADPDDAKEHMDVNVVGAWVGAGTPCFPERSTLEEFKTFVDNWLPSPLSDRWFQMRFAFRLGEDEPMHLPTVLRRYADAIEASQAADATSEEEAPN